MHKISSHVTQVAGRHFFERLNSQRLTQNSSANRNNERVDILLNTCVGAHNYLKVNTSWQAFCVKCSFPFFFKYQQSQVVLHIIFNAYA